MSGRTLEAALLVHDLASAPIRAVAAELDSAGQSMRRLNEDSGGPGGEGGDGDGGDNGGLIRGIGRNLRGVRDLTRAIAFADVAAQSLNVAWDLGQLEIARYKGDIEEMGKITKKIDEEASRIPMGVGEFYKLGSKMGAVFWEAFRDKTPDEHSWNPLTALANMAYSQDVTDSTAQEEEETKRMQEHAKHRASVQRELDEELARQHAAAMEVGQSATDRLLAKAEADMDKAEAKVNELRGKIRPSEDTGGKLAAEADRIEAEAVRAYQDATLKIRHDAIEKQKAEAAEGAAQIWDIQTRTRADALRDLGDNLGAELLLIKAHYDQVNQEDDKAMRAHKARELGNTDEIDYQRQQLLTARGREQEAAEDKARKNDADKKASATASAQNELLEHRISFLHEEGQLGDVAAEKEARRLEITRQINQEREQLRKIMQGEADAATKAQAAQQLADLDALEKQKLAQANASGPQGAPALVTSLGMVFGNSNGGRDVPRETADAAKATAKHAEKTANILDQILKHITKSSGSSPASGAVGLNAYTGF